jgi:hypothetical protein
MRFPLKVIATGIAATFLGYSAVPAVAANTSQNEAAPLATEQLGTHVRIGTVVSLLPTHMVITCRHKGKTAQLDLELNGITVQKGVISVGSQVAVHYRTQDNRNFATSVQLRKSFNEIGAEPAQY